MIISRICFLLLWNLFPRILAYIAFEWRQRWKKDNIWFVNHHIQWEKIVFCESCQKENKYYFPNFHFFSGFYFFSFKFEMKFNLFIKRFLLSFILLIWIYIVHLSECFMLIMIQIPHSYHNIYCNGFLIWVNGLVVKWKERIEQIVKILL